MDPGSLMSMPGFVKKHTTVHENPSDLYRMLLSYW